MSQDAASTEASPRPAVTVAERFASSLAQADCASFALVITGGLHEGARLRERRCLTVGSSPSDDLVLRDPGVDPGHAEVARLNGAWAVLCSQGQHTRALAPVASLRRGRCLRQCFELGGARLVLTQVLGAGQLLPQEAVRGPMVHMTPRRWALAGVAVVLALASAGLDVGQWPWASAQANREVPAEPDVRRLVAEGWPDVQLVSEPDGLTARGYVDDAEQLERLHQWLDAQQAQWQAQRRTLVRQLRTGAELVTLVREALGGRTGTGVTVDYTGGGIVRVQGTVTDLSVRERLRRVSADLAGVVQIEDRLAVVDLPVSLPKIRPLPFRILDVVPGPNGYFRADSGARYFVGATLADGAEVVSITPEAIEFQLGERRVLYPLK